MKSSLSSDCRKQTGLSAFHILCDGVSLESVRDFPGLHGATIDQIDLMAEMPQNFFGPSDKSADKKLILLISHIDEDRLSKALNLPFHACFEVAPQSNVQGDELLSMVEGCCAHVSLSTVSAYKTQVANYFSKWISQRIEVNYSLLANLELSIQEALANGLLHGNMGLKKTLPDSYHNLGTYGKNVNNRLSDQDHGQLRIEISASWSEDYIEIVVLDHGSGFDLEMPIAKGVTGWGLSLIRGMAESVTVTEGGRKITMRFSR